MIQTPPWPSDVMPWTDPKGLDNTASDGHLEAGDEAEALESVRKNGPKADSEE
jgi:hypothetical protein